MSGPYAGGLGKRKRSRNKSSSSEEENCNFFSLPERCADSNKRRRRVSPTDAEVISKFRPEDSNSNVMGWLHKIDQLGDIYGWDDTDRQFIMQLRLGGAAREWYDDLDDYNLTWDQWKQALHVAFPRSTDYVDRLEMMLARTKQDSETMTKYYHEKLSLLKKCNINGEHAISCIIRGLPHELRANAKAYNCNNPEQLYFGYLSSLENFQRVEAANMMRKTTWRRGGGSTSISSPAQHQQQLQPKICYACRRPGHEARNCRLQQRCEVCRRTGHTTSTCWFAPSTSRQYEQKDPGATAVGKQEQHRGTRPMQDGRVLTTTGNTGLATTGYNNRS